MIQWFAAALALARTPTLAQTPEANPTHNFMINEVLPIKLSTVQAGGYVGAAAMPAADDTLRAVELLVFPEAARGSGEGHSAWDLQPGSTMTNATVANLVTAADGRSLKLRYKNGEKTLTVPAVLRALAGRGGFVPPM